MMFAFLGILRAEIQLLLRDIPGLMILFLMPMILVLVLTLMRSAETGETTKLPMILINHDKNGEVAKELVKKLKKDKGVMIINSQDSQEITEEQAILDVYRGKEQILIIIPKNLTSSVKDYTKWIIQRSGKKPEMAKLQIYIDPAVSPAMKDSLDEQFQNFNIELEVLALQNALQRFTRSDKLDKEQPVLDIKTQYASKGRGQKITDPTAVQQYVPAWTLFGMWLILIPISAVFVKEREQGILLRFYVAPIPKIIILLGRIITYIFINLLQFILMLSIGFFILPLFGLDTLNIQGNMSELAAAGIFIALAATGFGVFLGVYAKTFEQAMALGPVLVIIFAAVGGIMAPLYTMPEELRMFSQYSPLAWGQNTFLNIFVRNAHFHEIMPDLLKLFIFFVITLLLSVLKYMSKR